METDTSEEHIAISPDELFTVLKGDRNEGSERVRNLIESSLYDNDWGYKVLGIKNIIVDEQVVFSDESASYPFRVEFKDCIFREELRFDQGTFQGWFRIYGGNYSGLSFSGVRFEGGVRISDGTFNEPIIVDGGYFHRLRIFGGTFKKEIAVLGGSYESPIQIGDPVVEKKLLLHKLAVDTRFSDRLEIRNTSVKYLSLRNEIDSGGYIKIQDSYVVHLQLDIANFGHLLFLNVAPLPENERTENSSLSISNSQLGTAYFNNFEFDLFDEIIVVNSSLESIRQFGTTFPTESKRIHASNDHGERNLKSLREVYNDLQNAAAKGKNNVLRHAYYAKQLDVYRQQLHAEKRYAEAVPLVAARVVSNYGQDWLRAVGFTTIITLLFYQLYILFHPAIDVGIEHLNPDSVIYHASKYLEFVFPIHKINLIPNPSGLSALVDLLGRVVSGFGLYHVVVAFRRFAMK